MTSTRPFIPVPDRPCANQAIAPLDDLPDPEAHLIEKASENVVVDAGQSFALGMDGEVDDGRAGREGIDVRPQLRLLGQAKPGTGGTAAREATPSERARHFLRYIDRRHGGLASQPGHSNRVTCCFFC
jgi:hypothetical protein